MSQIKYYIFVFLACSYCLTFAQQDVAEDTERLEIKLQQLLDQAKSSIFG